MGLEIKLDNAKMDAISNDLQNVNFCKLKNNMRICRMRRNGKCYGCVQFKPLRDHIAEIAQKHGVTPTFVSMMIKLRA